jgi:peptide/nickel transport system permease protein
MSSAAVTRARPVAPAGRSSLAEAARMFRKSGSAVFGLGLVVVLGIAATLAPLLAPHDPDTIDTARRLARPLTAGHVLGTDEFGRDLLSRLLYGARTSLVVGLAATALAAAAGSGLGLLAGFVGRWVDQVVMRSIDTLMAFPYFLLAIAIIATLGPGLVNGMVAVAIVNIPFYGRIVRATVLAVKQTEYVEAARALGVSELRLSLTHVLRNCLAPLIVAVTLNVGGMITALAGLSFLGLGVQPPTSDWGSMLSSSRQYMNVAPHVAALPGLAIFLAVLGFNLLGDGLRDALDPRLR